MASRIRTLNFLPEIFQTKTNAQFLAATLDQVVQQPEIRRIEGYIGSKFGYGINAKDYYVVEPNKTRTDYQLDPGIVFTKTDETVAKDFISYPGLLDSLKLEGGIVENNNRLFNSQFYSWDSFTGLDKIINFNEYYWIPEGPERVVVSNDVVFLTNDYIVNDLPNGYNIVPLTESNAGGAVNPTLILLRGGTYTFAVNQDTQFWIQGEPGVTGYSPVRPNVQTREVLGVSNNGASQGIVTFTVPEKNAQDQYNFPGNNLVDVVSTVPFANINGARLSDLPNGIDGITSLNGLTVLFYNTGVPNEIGYVSNFFDYTPYGENNSLTELKTVTITATNSMTDAITCNSTADLVPGNAIIFTGTPFGGISQYSPTLPNTIYFVENVINSTEFTISTTPNGSTYPLSTDSGTMTGIINQGQYEQGYYTTINDNFYTINYLGDPNDPVLRLTPANQIPTNQKITAVYGTQWITRNFYRDTFGYIQLIPYLSAQLDTLYYQDGTFPNKVGIIKLIESNSLNLLNVEEDILGKKQYTSPNGVKFTNGLKITFQGDVVPISYKTGEYYVEGVGTAIELLPVQNFIVPERFTSATYVPWDTIAWDMAAWEGNSGIPLTPDYITIARNAVDKNAWSRSNRWFHKDVIIATASYNNNPELVTLYATKEAKAKRPIIEFYPNIKMFNAGITGKAPVDFIDVRTNDAFSLVAGQENYYPDIEVYTSYTATIASTNYAPVRTCTAASNTTYIFTCNSTSGFRVNDKILFTGVPSPSNIVPGNEYYVSEVINGTTFKISDNKDGDVIGPSSPFAGSCDFNWYPQSTTVTVTNTDITGTFTVGQYITDSTNILPRNTQIYSITTGTTNTVLEVEWDTNTDIYFNNTSLASLVASDTTVDNYALFDGAKVIFAADTNLDVRNKIYISKFSELTPFSTPVITLTEVQDGDVLENQQTVALRGYYNSGKEFWFDGDQYIEGQQKTDVNQPPYFDIFDNNGISFGNKVIYSGTSFKGTKLFAYGIGSGLDDSILGFPLKYSQVDNVGDISFDVSLNLDTFDYVNGTTPITQKINTGYVHQYTSLENRDRFIGWQTAVSPSVQYQLFQFNYDPLMPSLIYTCDVSKWTDDRTNWPTIQVSINNHILYKDEYTVAVGPNTTTVTLNEYPIEETVIQVAILSDQVSKVAHYSIPINLSNNPLNNDLTTANIGDIRGQYQSMFFNNPETTGEVFGPNNFRDLGNMVPWGNKIIQNSASLALPGAFLRKQEYNLFNALLFNSREYVKFKNLLVYTVNNSDYEQRYDPSTMLDDALDQITASKNDTQAFFWSDMVPSKAPYISNTYSFANSLDVSIYPLSRIYDYKVANYYGVLVYLIRTTDGVTVTKQLIKDQDYIISEDAPSLTITLDLLQGDQIVIREYNQTYGSYIPNTPTKLGLYPSFIPKVILDSNYNEPTYFILGHDGSYNKLYGDYDPQTGLLVDFRDQVLLEFELRIYNNLKIDAVIPIEEYEVVPGYFRDTDYSYNEWLTMYSPSFLNWVGQNRLNYKYQYYNKTNNFTYNYSQSGNALNRSVITQGYWRGIYQYYYDTTIPNLAPWEMLGFKEMPNWWTSRYGPAPYTKDNLVLWDDLANGIDWNNGNPIVIPQAVRPGLLDIIPVDDQGNILPPIDTVVGSYNEKIFQREWKVGDGAPVEFSYRRSSTYPFDLIRLLALMNPAKFYNLAVDIDNYKYNAEFNQYLLNNRSHLKLTDISVYGNGTPVTSYINWVVDYEKQVGKDATTNITDLLANVDVRLVYRVAGFTDKTLLNFYVEKGTPNSKNASLLIPDESYSVILYDNQPFDRIIYSGIVVQISDTGGYTVSGNSQNLAYFRTLKPRYAGNYHTVTVEGASVKVTVDHYTQEQIVPYNTTFTTAQEVAQFLVDYGACLIDLGMKFEDQENELTINWYQMIAEFLYWSETGWSPGTVVTLNPAAKSLAIDKDSNIVQPLTIQQQNFVLNQNSYPIQINDLAINRQGTAFNVTALNQGDTLSYGQFNLSNFEHGIVFDNITLFGDIIYNLATGLRQNRILLKGKKSAAWDGTVNAAGFVLNQDNIQEWSRYTKYTKGEIVKYKNKYWIAIKIIQPSEVFKEDDWKRTDYDQIQKGLLPNASTRSVDSTLFYDVDRAALDQESDVAAAMRLIGYTSRDYLQQADLTETTQINVYKNLIKNKGTLNSVSAFKGAVLSQGGIDYDVYENWAIKAGEFGGVLNTNFIEFKVNEKYMTGNPAIVGLTEGIYNEGVQQEVPLYNVYNYGTPPASVDVLPTTSTEPSTVFPTAGYVNYNDVKMSAFFYAQMGIGVNKNGVIIPIQNFYVRDYAWLANYLEKWEVFTPTSMGQVTNVLNNLNNSMTVTFAQPHNLKQYEPFAIVNFDNAIDGYYVANIVVNPYKVLVSKVLDNSIKEVVGFGVALKFTSQRVGTPAEINDLPLLDSEFRKNRVWVDTDTSGGWGVYEKGINYTLQNQLTKTSSESYGSAVAIGDKLGYLIGDADKGQVYRYNYNDLTGVWDLVQTITEGTSFGSTISYSGDLYAISEITGATRQVNIYQLQNTILSQNLILIQSIAYPIGATTWGKAVRISGDQHWIYISDTDNNTVHVYQRSYVPTTAGFFEIGQTYTIESIGDTDFTAVGATCNDVGISFIATGIGSGTGVATKSTYFAVATIDGDTLGLTTSGDNFSYSLATDYNGDCLVVGAPNENDGTFNDRGYAYLFDRLRQNIEVQNNVSPTIFSLVWTPTAESKTLSSTTAPDTLTLNNTTNISVNDPIVFIGSGLAGTDIIDKQIYYVSSISGNDITIKLTRESLTDVSVSTNATVNVNAYIQTVPIIVHKNGSIVTDNNYIAVNNALLYTGALNAGDILTVDSQEFVYIQTFTTDTAQIGSQFGTSLDTNTHSSEIIIGAPYQLNSQIEEGVVYRYTDGGARYGTIIGTSTCNVTVASQILLNGYAVSIPVGNAETVANAIKGSRVTNITASALDGKLVISLIDKNLAPVNEKLFISVTDVSVLNELGIEVFTNTQKILCPHKYGPTQFGTVVKFNEFDSFVASAPVGTRYSATTFDFTDDENQDNDTIFDNNATQWVDESPNFGAVYMFDYISQYDPNIYNTGKFIYAQSVNSPNLVYTPFNSYNQDTDITYNTQPRYGTALDFNNYNVIVGTPNDTGATTGNTYAGSATVYNNSLRVKDWSLYRYSAPIVDVNKIFNIQLFSAETNQTLTNLDYIDPLQGKILGVARENIDIISNDDPAFYNNLDVIPGATVWGAAELGTTWLSTKNMRYINYHQNNDVAYNAQYWATLFPGSDVAVYTWVASSVLPTEYTGPGTPFDINSYSIQFVINAAGALVPTYYFWARDTNNVLTNSNKTLSDSIIASYIVNPKASGINYFAPILPNVYGLYNCYEYINANDSVLHIGYSIGNNDDVSHQQFDLIRDGFASDFLPGIPRGGVQTVHGSAITHGVSTRTVLDDPISLYARLLDSLSGVDLAGGVVPDPYLPKAVQTGVLARPRQSFFLNRFKGLQNYLEYANTIIKQYPIVEIRNSAFLNSSGEFYNTSDYWEFVNWWEVGYNNNVKSSVQVPIYADLSTLSVTSGTVAKVLANGNGSSEYYVYESTGNWRRIGLENGTIQFKTALWDYPSVKLGYGENFFDTDLYDLYPSEETRKIVRALNEEIYVDDLLIHRNKSLVLLFEYIQAETTESQNYLPWLNKTSLVDVSHTIRELRPLEIFQSDNQEFLSGYINEAKPYHVVIKEFLFKYTGTDDYTGDITDFDLPAKYDASTLQFMSPQLVYSNPSGSNQFLPTAPIWDQPEYQQWINNYGVSLTGQDNVQITTLASYIALNTNSFVVDNAQGLPINGIVQIGTEKIGYSYVDRELNVLYGITRGVDGAPITTHIPGDLIYINLPAVLVLDGGRGYIEPPKVTAFIDTSIYPAPRKAAVLNAVMSLDSVLRVDVMDPGEGYAVLPTIIIEPAATITFTSSAVNTVSNTVRLFAPLLQTGDLVEYKIGANTTAIGGLEANQWYYINVLETVPTVTVGFYTSYDDCVNNINRVKLYDTGSGSNHLISLGAKASAISTAVPVRENNITLRFDRTTYNSRVVDWAAGKYYGAFYAGSYSNSESVASSSIGLQSTQPPIDSILASAQGVAFEITDVRNERDVTYSSFIRYVESTEATDDSVRLILQDGGFGNPNASGGTNGFYIGMPIKFVGAVGSSGITNEQVYYVNSILNQTDFTLSLDPSGSPIVPLNDWTISIAGLQCLVGEVTDTAILTVNYPGILNITATQATTNKVTVPFNPTGTGGTRGFYMNLPLFFTGTDPNLPQNGVFGNIIENQVYYVTTVIDDQNFTMSETQNPQTFTVVATEAATDIVIINGDTTKLTVNEPVIFNTMIISGVEVTNFGGLISGTTYYVASIESSDSFTVSTSINGAVISLSDVSPAVDTSALVTSQKNTVQLTTATGNTMVVNVSLPVSPGQVNGQKFTLYQTSGEYPNITGTDSNLVTRTISALIGQRIIDGSPVDVNSIVLTNLNDGDTVNLWLTNIYVNMPIEVSETLGASFLTAGITYYVVDKGIIEVDVTYTTSSGNRLTTTTTEMLYADMPIIFSGSGIGGVQIDVEYWVKEVVDDQHFTITNTPGGPEIVVTTGSGLMTGTGLPYIKVSTSLGGSTVSPGDSQQEVTSFTVGANAVITVPDAPVNLTKIEFKALSNQGGSLPSGISENTTYYVRNLGVSGPNTFNISLTETGALITTSGAATAPNLMVIMQDVTVDQTPLSVPEFDVSYILGGYRVIIADPATGYAVDNVISIPGNLIGGATPLNDLTLTVSAIGTYGEIENVICFGIPAGTSEQYYLKVISPTEFAVYDNQLMTVPVSGIGLPYVGVTETTVTETQSATDIITVDSTTGFNVNDPVVFTGNVTGGMTSGQTYYILDNINFTSTTLQISDVPGGTPVPLSTALVQSYTMAKSGSFALLPEPFIFNQSIVKYNNRVYLCVISNNDNEFVFGKWQLLDSGDRRLNAMDRVYGYYQPTINMPGVDLTQLFEGVSYPNSTYKGNAFAPAQQYPIDTILQDRPFYPTEVDIKAIAWDGTNYFAPADMPDYSSVISSINGETWAIRKLTNLPINTTDIIYAGGYFILTSNNASTPLFRSPDGVTWTTNGFYTPWGGPPPYDMENWDMTSLSVASLSLNSVGYRNGIWVAVGENIVSSDDTYVWRQRYSYTNPLLTNTLYAVSGIDSGNFDGFIAVGKGQQFDYSGPVSQVVDINLILTSIDGINWNPINPVSTKGMFGVATDGTNIITVGEDGIIYISNNSSVWLGVNEVTVISVNEVSNELNVTSTLGFSVGDEVKFSTSFNVFAAGTTYYVVNIISDTQLQLSTTYGGLPVTLTVGNPTITTYMFAPRTASLRDVNFANGIYMAVGDNGLIKTSSDGYTWTTQTSGVTEDLNGLTYNLDDNYWIAVGDNNTVITSIDNGVTWVTSNVFVPQTNIYDVKGNDFLYGYGPEELVPGVVTDNITMTVATRPGTNWDETIYEHVGYNVVSVELTPQNGTQTQYSFDVRNLSNMQIPAQIAVYLIDGTTGLGTALYNGIDYTIDWINFNVVLPNPLTYLPVPDKLRIDVYEVGNGNQLVKANTKTDPIRLNTTTGWNEIYVNCNYTGELYNGSGVIRPGTLPVDVIVTQTESGSNTLVCDDVRHFVLNDPITFQGAVFGGIQEDTTYYVKTISYVTNRITVSTTINVGTGTAGPTLTLTDATGYMVSIIKTGYGQVWTDPIIYHNGNKLVLGTTNTVTRTKSATNSVVTNTSSGLVVNEPITFSDTMFGGVLLPQTIYYVKSIIDDNEFTVSATLGGATIALTNATGGAEFISNDYAFGIADNGISASIIFAKGNYDATVDYISYTLFGESTPIPYGYTLPETQTFVADGIQDTFNLTNYVGDSNPINAIVEVNGLRVMDTDYTIDPNTNEVIFVTPPANNDVVAVTSFNQTDRQYFNTQYGITGITVSQISTVSNTITPPVATTPCTATTTGTNVITCASTDNFVEGQTVEFKGVAGFGNIAVDGTVYFIKQVVSPTEFKISATNGGPVFALTTDSGTMVAYVGGQPTIRITTSSPHLLTTGDLVRIDGTGGSVQLNNNKFYVHVISATEFDIYLEPYDPALNGINSPVTIVSSYIAGSGGYVWLASAYTIVTTIVTDTSTDLVLGNRLTVADTSLLTIGVPIIFTGTALGGVSLNTTYYVKEIFNSTEFSISSTRGGNEFVLTNDTGSMNATEWEQYNVDRLWVTVNGYRVPSSSLRLNENNEVSILTAISSTDEVIITSMMPSATPNEEIFLTNINQEGQGIVYRANTQTRTWLTQPLSYTDDTIYVFDVTKITDLVTQNVTAPSPVDGIYSIGLIGDKRIISNVTVYNNTTSQTVSSSYYEIAIEGMAPILKISQGVTAGDSLTITILEGNLIYINGEQIKFESVDLVNNTVTGLQRGANGTGEQYYIAENTEVFGILSNNQMSNASYYLTWNSYVYNPVEGDPLQISETASATFLRGDVN